ncbi:hypothetical protein HBZS_122590 [Helicobacter bizzozeronii CCUG 35545]|nr:hypothetical protein HBZS_122590 [Helicobacter bizzozeronii CCUG 35545]
MLCGLCKRHNDYSSIKDWCALSVAELLPPPPLPPPKGD